MRAQNMPFSDLLYAMFRAASTRPSRPMLGSRDLSLGYKKAGWPHCGHPALFFDCDSFGDD
jgi:hypothetical protein